MKIQDSRFKITDRLVCSSLILISLLLIAPPLAYANEGVFISEVAWMGTEVSSNDEWIELYNNQDLPVDLTGWVLKSDDGAPEIVLDGYADAYGYYLLERTDDDTVPGIAASQIYTGTLGNTDETLGLYDAFGELVDYIASWFAGDNDTKETMQLDWKMEDEIWNMEWCTEIGTPGAINGCGSGTSGESGTSGGNIEIIISEVQANGEGVDYVEIECLDCSDVLVADISVNGKSADTEDVIQSGERVLFLLGSGTSGESGTSGGKEYKVSGSGVSGTQGEVELAYADTPLESVCWNPGGIVDETDENQMDLRDRGLWEGSCLDSDFLSSSVVLARDEIGWTYDHPTPGGENTFENQSPTAVITVQGSGLTEAQNSLTFNPTGEDSSDPDADPLIYVWDFGDGDFFEGKNPTSRVYGVGNFVVTLTVTDPFGAQSTATQNLSVTVPSSSGSGAVVVLSNPESTSYDFSDRIFINEIFPNPEGKDSESEFIELVNLDSRTVDLSGWKLDDEDGGSKPYNLEVRLLSREIRSFPISLTGVSLKNTSEVARLIDPDGRIVSQVLYEDAREGESYSRSDDGYDWASPTPGMENIFFDEEKYSSGLVTRCIDGDTFEARFDDETVSVRLLGVDAPETKHPDKEPEYFGEEASLYLCDLLLDKEIALTFDATKFDTYERLLAYVYVDDLFVNLHVLEEGFARLYDRFDFEKIEAFREAQLEAQEEQVGLWATGHELNGLEGMGTDEGQYFGQEELEDVRFMEFLINPAGVDEGKEYFILKNFGDSEVSLEGYELVVNEKGKVFSDFALSAGEERKFTSADISFSFRNTSGSVELVSPGGEIVDTFVYDEKVSDDEVLYLDLVTGLWRSSVSSDASDSIEIAFDFEDLVSGVSVEKRMLSLVRVVDITRLKDGVAGVTDDDFCYHVFFDTDKQTSLLLTLLYRQASLVSLEQDCFGDLCVLSRFIF